MKAGLRRWAILALFVLAVLGALAPTTALAHALPISYNPAPRSVLNAPPSQVSIVFSEGVNPAGSRLTVVDPTNHTLDKNDTHLVGNTGRELAVDLNLLPPGTYVVGWRTLSAQDGHIASGSYIFSIARADGTVPPVTNTLPTTITGLGGGGQASGTIDGPTLLATLIHWVALAALTVVLGIIFWWLFVMPRQLIAPETQEAIRRRLPQVADLALETVALATVGEFLAQAVVLGGSWRGAISWPTLSALLGSQYGTFMLVRVLLSLAGLVCLWVPQIRNAISASAQENVAMLYALALTVVYVFSGHGGATGTIYGPAIDMAHLLANGVWLGGLFVLAVVVLPALQGLSGAERARYLVQNIPAFSVPALFGATLLAVTGPLNAGARMTSFVQLWTTAYGIVLSIKILIFLGMAALSYVHAFRLRPQLAAELGFDAISAEPSTQVAPANALTRIEQTLERYLAWQPTSTAAFVATGGAEIGSPSLTQEPVIHNDGASPRVSALINAITTRMRVEALAGLFVLLCAALLGPLAGTLAAPLPTQAAVAGGTQKQTATVDGLHVTATLSPGRFGSNQLTVQVTNPDGKLASNGTVFVLASDLDMDMGTNQFNLQPSQNPGEYTGTVDLAMAGHWQLEIVVRTQEDPNTLHRATLSFTAS